MLPFHLNGKLLVLVLFDFFENPRLLVLRPSQFFFPPSIGSSSLGTLWELDPTDVNLKKREISRPKARGRGSFEEKIYNYYTKGQLGTFHFKKKTQLDQRLRDGDHLKKKLQATKG